ncbi:Elicitor peptide [Sesbania bispinosa]|nr:Elicitor peptide [Sesbania bispinosa]
MFDIGEELPVESYRIPWLIWIQLLVLLLLLALLFFFTIFPLDLDNNDATVEATAPASASTSSKRFIFDEIQQIDKPLTNHDSTAPVLTNHRHHTQGGENRSIKGEIGTCSSMRREEITEGEASSLNFHPCHYFQLATVAFLKCFGLDSTSDAPSNRKRRKRKES